MTVDMALVIMVLFFFVVLRVATGSWIEAVAAFAVIAIVAFLSALLTSYLVGV